MTEITINDYTPENIINYFNNQAQEANSNITFNDTIMHENVLPTSNKTSTIILKVTIKNADKKHLAIYKNEISKLLDLMTKRKLIVYNVENNKLEYDLWDRFLISKQEISRIKNKIAQNEKKAEKEQHDLDRYYANKIKIQNDLRKEQLKKEIQSKQSAIEESEKELVDRFAMLCSLNEKLNKLKEIQEDISKSKSEVLKVVNNLENKKDYLDVIHDQGFVLSYAGCLKIAMNYKINEKDIISTSRTETKIIDDDDSVRVTDEQLIDRVGGLRSKRKNEIDGKEVELVNDGDMQFMKTFEGLNERGAGVNENVVNLFYDECVFSDDEPGDPEYDR